MCFAPFLIWLLPVIAMTYPSLHCWQIGGIPEHLSQYLMLHSRQCWPDHPSSQRHIYFVLLLTQLPYTPHGFPSHGSIIVSHLSPVYPTGHVQPVQLAVTLPEFSQVSEQSKTYIIGHHCMHACALSYWCNCLHCNYQCSYMCIHWVSSRNSHHSCKDCQQCIYWSNHNQCSRYYGYNQESTTMSKLLNTNGRFSKLVQYVPEQLYPVYKPVQWQV